MNLFELRHKINSWLEAVPGGGCSSSNLELHGHHKDTLRFQTMPDTPPPSESLLVDALTLDPGPPTATAPRIPRTRDESPSKKRRLPESEQDNDETPRKLHKFSVLQPRSPGKRARSPGPIRSLRDLGRLEKPAFLTAASDAFRTLPADAKQLYHSITNATERTNFIPRAVKEEASVVLWNEGAIVRDSWFAPSANAVADDTVADDDGTKRQLLDEMAQLMHIVRKAKLSAAIKRHEAAWNSTVHQPILDLAFEDHSGWLAQQLDDGAQPMMASQEGSRHSAVQIRVENVSSATISGDCIPRLNTGEDAPSVGAWSVAENSVISSESGDSPGSALQVPLPLDSTVHSKSGSKKVDFAVVIEPEPGTSLHTAINTILRQVATIPALSWSINPFNYSPLVDCPMAIAIETKSVTASRDPLVQLGITAAAIHRRLHTLPIHRATGGSPVTLTGVLMTLPLIAVTDHRWELFLACDRGGSIELVGPLDLGGTTSLVSVYTLLSALRALKVWMQQSYCPALEEWFTTRGW